MSERSNLLTHWLTILLGLFTGLTFEQWISLVFVLIAVGTFFVNWYYKQKTLELDRAKILVTTSEEKP